ncbi:helix-turn-helix domain-containing protein [Fontibacillus sp. BL9]|uniref:helix-turn-helix domain-containing protein n=1 Tax=Fontibacillus sp. BL9 TaxID=3389971 RepID=UPI00397BCFD3
MFSLSDIYRPITAQPPKNSTHVEIEPCKELKPYIHCFWGTSRPYTNMPSPDNQQGLVIPDTCMDLIFDIDINTGRLTDIFSGINDAAFVLAESTGAPSTFAIRFYFWAVPLFSDESMHQALNAFAESESYFHNIRRDFQRILTDHHLIQDRVAFAEQYLLNKLNMNRRNNNVMNAVYKLLETRGTADIAELTGYTAVSQRQLERLFKEYTGLSPKKISGLIRYQHLWQDILKDRDFSIQDAVYKYGYADQSHLLHDFKKYHTMTPADARAYALS